jgi:hypothetical protein
LLWVCLACTDRRAPDEEVIHGGIYMPGGLRGDEVWRGGV